jgi:hypothetical protein
LPEGVNPWDDYPQNGSKQETNLLHYGVVDTLGYMGAIMSAAVDAWLLIYLPIVPFLGNAGSGRRTTAVKAHRHRR